jgi:hypothetical protein
VHLNRKPILITVLIIGIAVLAVVSFVVLRPASYVGKTAQLRQPTSSERSSIELAVSFQQPTVPAGTEYDVSIDAFTGSAVKGSVHYHGNYPWASFMAVKEKDGWHVIAYDKQRALVLPSTDTAQRYQLPADWYKS